MASKSNTNQFSKHAKKVVKRTHRGIVVIGMIFLIIGTVAGYFGAMKLSENDLFVLNGEKEITVPRGIPYTYSEEGAKIISLGRDLSDQIQISTDLTTDLNGNYFIDTSVETTYIITYTVNDIKYGNIKRIRTIKVIGGEN